MRAKLAETRAAYLFLLPFLLLLIVFFGYAAVRAIYFSFTDYDLFNAPNWVGFKNYRDLFTDANFVYALRNTVVFAIVVTVIQTFLALVMATILNNKIRGIQFFRAAFYMPSIASSVVITLIFLWHQLLGFGFPGKPSYHLSFFAYSSRFASCPSLIRAGERFTC
jgi:multiple sugar transport system permease protein